MPSTLFSFEHRYASLPAHLWAPAPPTPVHDPALVHLNADLASSLGIDPKQLAGPEGLSALAGNTVPQSAKPIAMAYAGHQFGHSVPVLGDGRAILLGELRDQSGDLWDIQLKGAGKTPFSRRGTDGRAWLGPVLREYVVSEAMHALGIPTTRALAAVRTGQPVLRERPYPGAILTRVARSHIRVGTFEYLAHHRDVEGREALVAHVMAQHYPEVQESTCPALALLEQVVARQVKLVTAWLSVGFIHGVMNTDNCSIVGDTIDYGPCAFLDTYHPETVFSSIDHYGRYAYANQPRIALWNIAVLANALLPLLGEHGIDAAKEVLDTFPNAFAMAYEATMRAKLGLHTEAPEDGALVADLLSAMARNEADFTATFRALSHLDATASPADLAVRAQFNTPDEFDAWVLRWRKRLSMETVTDDERKKHMQRTNPAYIPRNHVIEAMIQAALIGDFQPLEQLIEALSQPFVEREAMHSLSTPPTACERIDRTFCGT